MDKNKRTQVIAIILFVGVIALYRFCTSDFMTDGATRIAYELKTGADVARKAGQYTLTHIPKPEPEGCHEDYQIQFSENSSIVIWCRKAGTKEATSSHTTTYHLNFVKSPKKFIVEKKKGEATYIDLKYIDGQVIIENVK